MSSAAAGVVHVDLEQGAVGGVERGVAELFGVHFAEAFEAGDVQALFAGGADGGGQAAEVFEAGFVFAAAEGVAAVSSPVRSWGMRASMVEAESWSGRRGRVLIVRTSCSSTMWRRWAMGMRVAGCRAASPLVLGAGRLLAGGGVVHADVDV